MKKIISILLTATLTITPVFAEKLYENITREQITKGVVYEEINTYTTDGWQRINVIEIDLTDNDLEVKVLTPDKGSSTLATVKQMAESNNTKAAVNGDFFNFSSGETNMLGMTVSKGELISTPAKDGLASFALTEDNSPIFDYFTFSGTLYAENTSLIDLASVELYQVNKVPLTTGAITMITSAWGDKVNIPIGNYAMISEPYDDFQYKMVGFSWGGEPVAIPEGGAVFTANYSINGFLNTNIAMGDLIRVEYSLSPDIPAIKESVGGNTLIVKNGGICEFTNNISGKNPRTALGTSASGDKLFMVTVDGRKSDCPGFTQTELAQLMIDLGCANAINLDGGGSTTMVAKDRLTDVQVVKNNVSSLRQVSNGIGVVSHLAPLSIASGGKIQLSAENIVCDDTLEVYYVFYDENYNNVAAVTPVISTSDENAVISGNKVTFKTPGIHSVSVTSQGVTLETKVRVLGDFFAIDISPETASVTDKDRAFTITAYDNCGYSAVVPSSQVEFEHSSTLSMNGNTVKKTTASGTVTAKYKNLTANAVVNGEKHIRENDITSNDLYYGRIDSGQEIIVTGSTPTPKTLLDMLQFKKYLDSLNPDSDIYATSVLYDNWGVLDNYLIANNFTECTVENSRIVTVSAKTSASIRLTDPSAWGRIKNVCNNADEKNIVFILDTARHNLDASEKPVWDHYMSVLTERGKNVFVVAPEEKSEATVYKGVRYLYSGNLGNCTYNSFFYGLEQSKPLRLTFSGDEIKYRFQ